MIRNKEETHEMRNRILFTVLIVVIYLVAQQVVLFGTDFNAGNQNITDAQSAVFAMLSGSTSKFSIMILGIMPYITASIIVQFVNAFRSTEAKGRTSQLKMERMLFVFTVILAVAFAFYRSADLTYTIDFGNPWISRGIVMAEMVGGSILVYFLALINKNHGVGGQTPIILVNILETLFNTFYLHGTDNIVLVIIICVILIEATIIMEVVTINTPVQRVSIHSIYADKDYIAFKLNPIGIMPIMFATSVLMIPQMIIKVLCGRFPSNSTLIWLNDNLVLTEFFGIIVYLIIVFVLTIIFAFVMINPKQIAEDLQRSGDSIVGVYAGKPTLRYLNRKLFGISAISGAFLSVGMGISLFLALMGKIPTDLAMLPSSAMVLAGIVVSVIIELRTYKKFDLYSFFM